MNSEKENERNFMLDFQGKQLSYSIFKDLSRTKDKEKREKICEEDVGGELLEPEAKPTHAKQRCQT